MELTPGSVDIRVAVIDGPVATDHPHLVAENIVEIQSRFSATCYQSYSKACQHGTSVTSILFAKRTSQAPAICPNCTCLLRPIFFEEISDQNHIPTASPIDLADAIFDCIKARANLINLSVSLTMHSMENHQNLKEALDLAAKKGVIIVAAAGNSRIIGGNILTNHPWVIPVVACNSHGLPLDDSTLGVSISKNGMRAPGDNITSLGNQRETPIKLGGTSAAAPFVTGTVALLWSEFPLAPAYILNCAVTKFVRKKRNAITPPMLNAWDAYEAIKKLFP